MLTVRTFLSWEGVTIADVTCRHETGIGDDEQYTGAHSLAFVRRGCFIRSVQGAETLLEPSTAFCLNPGEEQRYDHPHEHGDDCTVLGFDNQALGSLGDALPSEPLHTTPGIDLEHRLLIAGVQRGQDQHELVERAWTLLASTIGLRRETTASSARPGAASAHRILITRAREALAADPDRSLSDLASELAVSPYHLSRVFRAQTGHTLARHRNRLRVRHALDRLAAGEQDLARLAADVGFRDQSYLCRVIRGETGGTPTALRAALEDQRVTGEELGSFGPRCVSGGAS